MENLNNSTIIRNISKNQKEILWNIMQLHNNGLPFECDMTASKMVFYKSKKNDRFIIPQPKYLFDVYPISDEVQKIIPFKKLPLEDNSISSIVIDLPCVFKCQSMVSGGIQHCTEEYSFLCAQKVGFYVKDKFYLEAENRLISAGKYKSQQHARKYTSVFYVFQKGNKKSNKVNYLNMLDILNVSDLEGKVWEIK